MSRLFDMSTVLDGEKEAAEWLQQLFREKDSLQDSFLKNGDFFTGTGFPRYEPIEMQPRLCSCELLYFSIGVGICKHYQIPAK